MPLLYLTAPSLVVALPLPYFAGPPLNRDLRHKAIAGFCDTLRVVAMPPHSPTMPRFTQAWIHHAVARLEYALPPRYTTERYRN